MKKGFTLAEVLITLSILGIVAAISIPNIIQNYQKQATVSRLKMAYSMLDRLTQQSYIENGYPPLGIGMDKSFFDKYFGKYLNISKECGLQIDSNNIATGCFKTGALGEFGNTDIFYDIGGIAQATGGYSSPNYYKVLLKNNMGVGILRATMYHGYIFVVDIDGPNRGQSKMGQDVFQFSYVSPNIQYNLCNQTGLLPGSFDARKFGCNISREDLLKKCTEGTYDKTDTVVYPNGSRCAGLIIKDGWKISSDYPWSYAHKKINS